MCNKPDKNDSLLYRKGYTKCLMDIINLIERVSVSDHRLLTKKDTVFLHTLLGKIWDQRDRWMKEGAIAAFRIDKNGKVLEILWPDSKPDSK